MTSITVHVELTAVLHKRYVAASKEALLTEVQILIGTTLAQPLPEHMADIDPFQFRLEEQPEKGRFELRATGNAFWIEYLVSEAREIGWKQKHSVFLSEVVEVRPTVSLAEARAGAPNALVAVAPARAGHGPRSVRVEAAAPRLGSASVAAAANAAAHRRPVNIAGTRRRRLGAQYAAGGAPFYNQADAALLGAAFSRLMTGADPTTSVNLAALERMARRRGGSRRQTRRNRRKQ
jgi:hypothetical protein